MRTIKIPFENERGSFFIEVLLPFEHPLIDEFNELTVEVAKMREVFKDYENRVITRESLRREDQRIMDQFYRFLADVCVDPSLNYEFWSKGEGYSQDVPLTIFYVITEEFLKRYLEKLGGAN